MKNFFDVFKIPPAPGTSQSAAPGTGPYQRDEQINSKPQAQGGRVIPPSAPPNATGYGSGGDSEKLPPEPVQPTAARHRPTVMGGPPAPLVPRYTRLYDTLRSREAWRYTADVRIPGTITPVTATDTANAVTLPNNLGFITNRLSQFPGGIALFLVVRHFSCAPVAVTATGECSWYFEDIYQNLVPLTDIPASAAGSGQSLPAVCPSPLTDSGLTTLGKIHVVGNTIASAAAYFYQLGFSFAYQLPEPALNGYDILRPFMQEHGDREILRENS